MLIITPKELIETLKNYKEDEPLLVTWWSQEDVEMLMADEMIDDADKAKEIWENAIFELDNRTSDHAISYVNDELATMVADEMGEV